MPLSAFHFARLKNRLSEMIGLRFSQKPSRFGGFPLSAHLLLISATDGAT
jgi:hypothetical protein